MKPFSEMTNAELDEHIAKLRGCEDKSFAYPPYKLTRVYPPPYSPTTDPRYAMELLEEMPNPQITKDVDFWRVVPDVDVDMEHYIICDDINLERAISEAWLQWREQG